MVFDHVEALRGWLAGGGFAPSVEIPDDAHEYMACLFVDFAEVLKADRTGLTFYGRKDGQEVYITTLAWDVLLREASDEENMNARLDKRERDAARELAHMAGGADPDGGLFTDDDDEDGDFKDDCAEDDDDGIPY
jgi:hypothetical protein